MESGNRRIYPIYYINPNSKDVNYSSENDLQLSVGVILHNGNDENEAETVTGYRSNVFFTNDNTKVTVYKLDKDTVMPHAVYGDWLTDDKIDTASEVGFNNQTGKARVNFNRKTIDNPYVIKVVSKVDPKKENINLYSAAKFYGNDGNFTTSPTWLGLNNNILTVESSAGGELPEEVNGTFEELHVYEEYENGKLVNTTTISVPIVEGTKDEQFTTAAKPEGTEEDPKEGFELAVDEIIKSAEIHATLTGESVTQNFVAGKNLQVTYVYKKDTTPVEEKGSFTEHHVYEVYKDGEKQEDQTTNIHLDKVEGTEEETFTTSAKPDGTDDNKKEGFTLVKEEIKKSDKITDELDGEPKDIHFIPNEDLEVTYVYRKDITSEDPMEEKGSFTEIHEYYEYDKDGKLVNTNTITIPKTEGTKDEQFTTAAKPNGTEENPKEDFELVITKIEKSDEIEEELTGQEVTKNFIPGKDLEVRYVYEKTVENTTPVDPKEDKGTFVETHIYEEYENGKLVKTSEIKIPAQEGTKEEEFTTSAKPDGTKENPKEGFELVPERIEKSDEITKTIDGSEVKDNFVPKKELKVTYVYKKDTKTTTPEGPSDPTPASPGTPALLADR